ncbi:MAG: DUF3035 domain-containing protein [Alphaproteobacteria bacterium]
MTRGMVLRLFATIALSAALTACEGVRDQFGLTKQSPDEFRVVARAPLTLPPDFILRPPEPGVARPQEGTTAQQARKAIFRVDESKVAVLDASTAADGRSLGERSLLRSAGVENIDPNIRNVVERETLRLNAESEGFIDALVFWREEEIPGVIVDAQSEAQRLRENAALGEGVTKGRTPTIERGGKAFLEGIF